MFLMKPVYERYSINSHPEGFFIVAQTRQIMFRIGIIYAQRFIDILGYIPFARY